MCPECKLRVLQEVERIDGVLKDQNQRLLHENRMLWELNRSLEDQRFGLLKAIEKLGADVKTVSLDLETLPLF